jgi:hypothetical protein
MILLEPVKRDRVWLRLTDMMEVSSARIGSSRTRLGVKVHCSLLLMVRVEATRGNSPIGGSGGTREGEQGCTSKLKPSKEEIAPCSPLVPRLEHAKGDSSRLELDTRERASRVLDLS